MRSGGSILPRHLGGRFLPQPSHGYATPAERLKEFVALAPKDARATVSMEPAQLQRTVERMQNHPGANIAEGELERIAASLMVARCARCHGEETLNLMVLKTLPERLATIRRMVALPGSGVRPDQALAIAQAFEKLINDGPDRDNYSPPVQSAR